MTGEENKTDGAEGTEPKEERTQVELGYAASSAVVSEEGRATLALSTNTHRDPVSLDGVVKDPIRLREALSALHAVVASDFRYKPKDRTAYLAYQRLKKEASAGDRFSAQQAYFTWLARNDPMAWFILDPVVSVHPDATVFEVFSKDEGTYAALSVDREILELDGEPSCGTTNIDFSDDLAAAIERMRSYRQTRLTIGTDAVAVDTEAVGKTIEKQINLPSSWLRGFLQVQSSAALPVESFTMAPVDLYNVLRHLRLHKDQKRKRRGLRIELVPGETPRLVLEPWETVIETTAGVHQGKQAKVVRVWGRRRLMLLRRVLPLAESIDVHLLGSGLPSFWVFRAGGLTLTLGMTGFTSSNWSQALNFDLLLPRSHDANAAATRVADHLRDSSWKGTREEIGAALGLKGNELLEALTAGTQQGLLMYDVAHKQYRYRPLLGEALDLEKLEFRNDAERRARDLLATKGAVKIAKENRILGEGVELIGKVVVAADKRDYRPSFLLDEEAQIRRAECTCSQFRKHRLKQGPCAHLIALRLAYGEEEQRRREGRGKGRQSIVTETRTYSQRRPDGEQIYQLTLDQTRLKIRWGKRNDSLRVQTLVFNSTDDARDAYFTRVDDLEARGFLDASAA